MGMRVEQHLHILGAKAQGADVGENLRRGLDESAVDDDVSVRRGDEEGGYLGRSHVIDVSGDPERCDRLVPGTALGIGLREQRCENH